MQTTSKSNSSLEITGLSEGTPYYFVVRTFTPAHVSNPNALTTVWSTEVSATTQSGGHTNCATQTEIPQAECETPVALYNSTGGPGWTNNTGWNVTQTPCSWHGVACSGGHITHLGLGWIFGNNLVGSIPMEIGDLTNLQSLNLPGNQLSGSIPDLSALPNLQTLDLTWNQLSGSIPIWIGNLINLQNLRTWRQPVEWEYPRPECAPQSAKP